MAGREYSTDGMSDAQREVLFNNAIGGFDPLDLILELEQLALDEGYNNVHEYIATLRNTTIN